VAGLLVVEAAAGLAVASRVLEALVGGLAAAVDVAEVKLLDGGPHGLAASWARRPGDEGGEEDGA
jgi:hypothetical protein